MEGFLVLAVIAGLVLAVWIVGRETSRQKHLKMTFDFNNRLLDRSSMKDFTEFLQTDQGTKFIESLTIEREASGPSESMLRAIRTGAVLVSLGLGLLFVGEFHRFEGREAITAAGIVSLAVGVGFLVSCGVSYRLARTLGVLDKNERRTP